KAERGGPAGLIAPWDEGGRGKFAGQPAVVIGGSSSVGQYAIQLAKLSGYDPIITIASAHNEAYCKSAGATHVIDYHKVPYSALPAAVAEIASSVPLVYDAISEADSQKASWEIAAPQGIVIVTRAPVVGKIGQEAEDGKRVFYTYGVVHTADNQEKGGILYRVLPSLLAEGLIKPNAVEVLPGGLAGIVGGLERLKAGKVSGVKLVAHPQETA
ncbi:NAD(P)-binding protein, partial [Auriscalpium vulgare]